MEAPEHKYYFDESYLFDDLVNYRVCHPKNHLEGFVSKPDYPPVIGKPKRNLKKKKLQRLARRKNR